MFLRNHGLVVVGRSVEEAFTRAYHTVLACEAQITMMSAGLENLIIVSEEAKQRSMVKWQPFLVENICYLNFLPVTQEVVRRAQQMIEDGALKNKPGTQVDKKPQVRWNIGDLEYEAYMRMLDSAVRFIISS